MATTAAPMAIANDSAGVSIASWDLKVDITIVTNSYHVFRNSTFLRDRAIALLRASFAGRSLQTPYRCHLPMPFGKAEELYDN